MSIDRQCGSPRSSALSVLVVDDDDDIRDMLRALLEDEGLTVVTASDGPQALALLGGGLEPGLILMDIMMPGMSGLEVLARIRNDKARATIPIAIMSGSHLGGALGSTYFLKKPFQLDHLLRLVRRHGTAGARAVSAESASSRGVVSPLQSAAA